MISLCVLEVRIKFLAKGRLFDIALRSIVGKSGFEESFSEPTFKPVNNGILALYGGYGLHAVKWG